jgi:hypothetical protein
LKRLFLSVLACASIGAARAQPEFAQQRGWLHVNGYTHHFAVDDANDRLFGLGLTYYGRLHGRIIPAWEFDAFQDSAKKLSTYVGRSWTIPLRYVSVGVTGALMYHRNFSSQNRLRVLPVAFPFLETRGTRLKARLYYIAPARRASDEQIAIQLMWALPNR